MLGRLTCALRSLFAPGRFSVPSSVRIGRTSPRRAFALAAAVVVAASGARAANVVTLPSSFSVDNLGSAKLDVPLDLPPGTSGMAPHLSLSYSSSNGNGYVGVGWTLSGLPAITRCPNTIATDGFAGPVNFANGPNVTPHDVFCFQGQPLVQAQQQSAAGQQASQGQQFAPGEQLILLPPPYNPPNTYYGEDSAVYTTEIEGFSRIVSHGDANGGPASFTVYMRSGLIYDFGGVPNVNSQVMCTAAPACGTPTVMTWMLDRVTDTVGNTINITYVQNNARAYPNTITYTTNQTTNPQLTTPENTIAFTYINSRPDAPTQFLGGQQIQTNYLLQTITTSVVTPATTYPRVSVYTLWSCNAFASCNQGLTGRSQLRTITRTGFDSSALLPLNSPIATAAGRRRIC